MVDLKQRLSAYINRRNTKRERIKRNVEKEDFLLNQIDEFREKAKQLQKLIASKENKVQELQVIVEEREGKAKELSDIIDERSDAAERVVAGVGTQIEGMIAKVDDKLNELNKTFAERLAENAVNSSEQNEEVRTLVEEHNAKLTETISGLNEQFESIKNEIFEKIHTEDVKCYRNIQTLIEESDKKIEEMDENLGSLFSMNKFIKVIMVFSALNFVGLAGFIVYVLGFVRF